MGLSIITLPLFTILMSPAEIGLYSTFVALAGLVIVIFSFNLYSGVSRYYFEKDDDFNEFLGTSVVLTFASMLVFFFIILLFNSQIDTLLNLPSGFTILLFFFSAFSILESIYNQILIASRKSIQYVILSSSKFFIILVISLILVYELTSNKYWGRIWPLFIISGFYSLYYFKRIFSLIKFRVTTKHIKYVVFFCVPLIPYSLSGIILNSFDRIFINATVGPTQSGLYSVGYTIGALVSLWVTAIHYAQTPDFYKTMNSADVNQYKIYFLLAKRLFSILVFLAFTLILYSKDLLMVFLPSKFYDSYVIITPVVIGYVFLSLFNFYGQYIGYTKKTVFSSIVLLASGLLNIFLNVLLIPIFGYQIAAYTTLISYCFLFLFSWFVANAVLKMDVIPVRLILQPFIIFIWSVLIFVGLTNLILNFLVLFIIKSILLILVGLVIFNSEIRKLLFTNN